ncbi:hypothetical protein F5890DRAFT_1519736 [Lentinula detonsa]|uniref:Uncharacterized protein n=1 Tax=Lentinula detonsa TaxID=2804962 RepID=A0AA38UTT6_9AGAR|nr:hypothetical protein F5890DRAFT_1519736 [Lentinula detonsa]
MESSALPLSLLRPSPSKTFRHQDTLQLKLLVVFISVLDTAHQIMLSHSIYMYLVSGFGNVKYLEVVTWSMIVSFRSLTDLGTDIFCYQDHGVIIGFDCCEHSTVYVLAHMDFEQE